MFFLHIVNFKFVAFPSLRIKSGDPGADHKQFIGKRSSFGTHNHMGAGNLLRMKPPIAASGQLEGQLVVLEVVFPDIDMETIFCDKVQGLAFFGLPLLFAGAFFRVAGLVELASDIPKVGFAVGDSDGVLDGGEMRDRLFGFCKLSRNCLLGSL